MQQPQRWDALNFAWLTEPDNLQLEANGYQCEIKRVPSLLHLCGYVTVPTTHPCHAKHCDEVDVNVHGGLTYAKTDDYGTTFGFDCSHLGDLVPGMLRYAGGAAMALEYGDAYRDIAYVTAQINWLAQQLHDYKE